MFYMYVSVICVCFWIQTCKLCMSLIVCGVYGVSISVCFYVVCFHVVYCVSVYISMLFVGLYVFVCICVVCVCIVDIVCVVHMACNGSSVYTD